MINAFILGIDIQCKLNNVFDVISPIAPQVQTALVGLPIYGKGEMEKPDKALHHAERKFIHLLLTQKIDIGKVQADFPPTIFDAYLRPLVTAIYEEFSENGQALTRVRYRQKLVAAKVGGDLIQNMTTYDRCFMEEYAKPEDFGELKQLVFESAASRVATQAIQEFEKTSKSDGYEKALTKMRDRLSKTGIDTGALDVVTLSKVEKCSATWLWDQRIEMGAINLFSGDPGTGKSFVSNYIAARVSKGEPLPGTNMPTPKGDTLMIAVEDSPGIIRERYEAQDGDLDRVHIIRGKTDGRMLSLANDLPLLEQMIHRFPETRLVVVDPINAYLGDVDSYKNSDVLRVLNPLHKFAQDHGVAIIAVRHMTKGSRNTPLHKGLGSISFSGTGRTEWGFVKDREDETKANMVLLKMSHAAPSSNLRYTINNELKLEWEATDVTATEAFAEAQTMPKKRAQEWLETVLADGPLESDKVQEMARKEGISWRTLSNAKKDLGIKSRKVGGHWEMELPAVAEDTKL